MMTGLLRAIDKLETTMALLCDGLRDRPPTDILAASRPIGRWERWAGGAESGRRRDEAEARATLSHSGASMIDPAEAITLAADTASLGRQLAAALATDSDEGKKISRTEAAALVQLALRFARRLVRDLAD